MKSFSSEIPSAEALIARCHELEKMAHVTLDDVLNKATQEVAEMLEAAVAGNVLETKKEAGDALLNVLSASAALGIHWLSGIRTSGMPSSGRGTPFENVLGRGIGSGPTASRRAAGGTDPIPKPACGLFSWTGDHRSWTGKAGDWIPESPASLFLKLGAWNSKIQSLRGRYSRSKTSAEDVRAATGDLVEAILSFVPEADPVAMIGETVAKFESRVEAYLPKLDLRDYVGAHADFPKPGILFRDVSPMLASPEAMKVAAHEISLRCRDAEIIVGLDARGFLFGLAAAEILGKPFVMVRKKGKLPGETISKAYGLEYGQDVIEIQKQADIIGKKVAIVDDLLATGGTALAAAELVEKAGGIVGSVVCAIGLDDLAAMPGRQELKAKYRVDCVLSYE